MKKESIEHVLIATGTPRANGLIERLNRTLTPMLAKMSDDPRKWDQVLESVEFAINNTICRSTGNTPSKLLFGLDQVGAIKDLVRLSLEQSIETRDLKESREAASCKIIKNQTENEKAYDRSRKKATMYNVGDYVMIVSIFRNTKDLTSCIKF